VREEDGRFEADTVNGRVDDRLGVFVEMLKAFAGSEWRPVAVAG
jgi:hypothetical protein